VGRYPFDVELFHLLLQAGLSRRFPLIWNQRHLLHALREYEQFYNQHRPHQGIANARPLNPLPKPITDPDQLARLNIHRRDRLGGILREYRRAA
jgi:putative transposase